MINPRKLAAIDLYFLGPKIILAEFGLGVPVMFVLGILSLRAGLFHTHATWQIVLGAYLLLLGINYMPMLWCALDIARRSTAAVELGDELQDKTTAMRKYRKQSLWLLVPLAAPLAWLRQRGRATEGGRSGM
ncbi:MAG TPA: hypothetical protein VMU45_01945 [Candidatus Eisenbacteria bacterium]|nr:hypothetical protein [Candidatus Eisenbacteria bacterium]